MRSVPVGASSSRRPAGAAFGVGVPVHLALEDCVVYRVEADGRREPVLATDPYPWPTVCKIQKLSVDAQGVTAQGVGQIVVDAEADDEVFLARLHMDIGGPLAHRLKDYRVDPANDRRFIADIDQVDIFLGLFLGRCLAFFFL